MNFARGILTLTALLASAQTPAVVENGDTSKVESAAKATVYFYRHRRFEGSALEPTVFLGDQPLAKMDNGRYFAVQLAPGKAVFRSTDKSTVLPLTVEPGSRYFVRVSIVSGLWKGGGQLTLVPEDQGELEIKRVKLLDAKKVTDPANVSQPSVERLKR